MRRGQAPAQGSSCGLRRSSRRKSRNKGACDLTGDGQGVMPGTSYGAPPGDWLSTELGITPSTVGLDSTSPVPKTNNPSQLEPGPEERAGEGSTTHRAACANAREQGTDWGEIKEGAGGCGYGGDREVSVVSVEGPMFKGYSGCRVTLGCCRGQHEDRKALRKAPPKQRTQRSRKHRQGDCSPVLNEALGGQSRGRMPGGRAGCLEEVWGAGGSLPASPVWP